MSNISILIETNGDKVRHADCVGWWFAQCPISNASRVRPERQARRSTPQPYDHATTRSGTSSLPLVSGASSRATIKFTAPNTVPISIGMAKPSCQVVAK